MAPNSSRQVLVWSLPTLAFLLSLLWYRRKRAASLRSDPGGTNQDIASTTKQDQCMSIKEELSQRETSTVSAETEIEVESVSCEVSVDEPSTQKIVLCDLNSEPVLESVVKSTIIPSLFTTVAVSSDSDKDTEILETQEISEPEIKASESLEKPECLIDKISDTRLFVPPIETCEIEEINITAESKVEACTSLFESVEIDTTAEKVIIEALESSSKEECVNELPLEVEFPEAVDSSVNVQVPEALESSMSSEIPEASEILVLPVTSLEVPEASAILELSVTSLEIPEASEILELPVTEVNAEELPLQINISEGAESAVHNCETVENLESASNKDSLLLVEEECDNSVDSSSVAMARKTSRETSSMDHEDESNKKFCSGAGLLGNDANSLEGKFSALGLDGNRTAQAASDVESVSTSGAAAGSYTTPSEHQGAERDSANHSPADVMLASPSISSYSDEGSSDSGKGCSDVATPPSRTPASGSSLSGDAPVPSVYEFVLPQHLVGRLIGRHGCFVHQIKEKTNASILIKRHPDTQKMKICAVEGAQADIESALEMIRLKFPVKRYPSVTLEQVCFLPPAPTFPLIPEFLQLQLVEGVNNDVILSSLVSAGHFFLQQPTHPTFPALNRLNACMNICYSEPTAPALPLPTQAGVICAAPTMGGWYRAQVVSTNDENETCDIKFVDYGGYLTVNTSVLRQIRSDFMTLPFQAAECYLANVAPIGGEEWNKESYAGMEELTHGQVLQAQIVTYSDEGLPIVFLYAVHDNQVVLVNQELVSRGLGEWMDMIDG